MLTAVSKMFVLISAALFATACIPRPTFAENESAPCPLRGNVFQQVEPAPPDCPADPATCDKYVSLWFVGKWHPGFTEVSADPVLYSPPAMSAQEVDRLCKQMNRSEVIHHKVMAWGLWYQTLLGAVPEAMKNFTPNPSNRFTINIVVTSEKRIIATVTDDLAPGQLSYSMSAARLKHVQRNDYAHRLAKALNALNGKNILAFPVHSKAAQVEFKLQEGYPILGVELEAIRNTID